ncbi:hypothetical protein NDU88_003808 [Pleurodeles waltl]|uniref:Uncharacterized protein n=1 Tax=Pleurodeles waltl TaxID=8319 RepID=A0AAV7T6M4_PLEWA|nr:hypothetical protein NDU88_003808 [Pleurodeles waltl]
MPRTCSEAERAGQRRGHVCLLPGSGAVLLHALPAGCSSDATELLVAGTSDGQLLPGTRGRSPSAWPPRREEGCRLPVEVVIEHSCLGTGDGPPWMGTSDGLAHPGYQ